MGVEFVGRGTLLIHGHAHFFELMQDEFDALIHGHAMSDETVQRLVDRIVLVIAYPVGIEAGRSLLLLIQYPHRDGSRCRSASAQYVTGSAPAISNWRATKCSTGGV